MRLVNMQRANEANNDILWVMGLWLRITVVLSGVALVLSLAGIYAVLSFTVVRRTREIGVRVALGAGRRRVVVATFRRPLFQVALGVVVGTAIIFTAATLIRNTELPSESDLTLQGMGAVDRETERGREGKGRERSEYRAVFEHHWHWPEHHVRITPAT